jgi:hypothetical protein
MSVAYSPSATAVDRGELADVAASLRFVHP